ncbi:MAG: MucB/RseB C-terminal domain-containing protein [Pseudomonadota bacterium]|nr:MucB/RseB C-terminal domain-containing protein [Pseudomonadota bacterium]
MKLTLFFLLLVNLAMVSCAQAQDQSMDLLKKMNQAVNSVNYDGVFLYVDEKHIHTLRVIHKIQDGSVRERLYALNGVPREVIRDAERVWCFMPEMKMGHAGLRSDKATGFPGFMVKNLAALVNNYQISTDGIDRIADRSVTRLQILPRDGLRYGYDLWADQETGLLLKSALIDNAENVIEQYMFALIEIGGDIPESALLPMTDNDALEWHSNKQPPVNTPVKDSQWQFSALPAGYRLVNIIQRSIPMDAEPFEHMILSDGLAGVSVFIEKMSNPASGTGLDQMGAVNSYTRVIDDYLITAIGEVPSATVKVIGDALVTRH